MFGVIMLGFSILVMGWLVGDIFVKFLYMLGLWLENVVILGGNFVNLVLFLLFNFLVRLVWKFCVNSCD